MNSLKAKRPSDRVGAVFLLRRDGSALLQLRDEKPGLRHGGLWVPPGGHAELGEEIEACAKRELLEETGYTCTSLNWLDEFEDIVQGWPAYTLTIFFGFYDEIQELVCNEGQALCFINRREAGQYPIPNYLIELWDRAIALSKRMAQH